MSSARTLRQAVVIGAERPFGNEIARRLAADGFAVAATPEGGGPLDLLVVNSPVRDARTRFRELTDADMMAALQTQLIEPALAVQAVAARLVGGARIVFVASRAHLGGWAGADAIAAGAALIGMSRSLALELAERGVTVNVLAPDYVELPWDTPAARDEIAATVAWLASADGAAISGETLLLDRGRTLRMSESARR